LQEVYNVSQLVEGVGAGNWWCHNGSAHGWSEIKHDIDFVVPGGGK